LKNSAAVAAASAVGISIPQEAHAKAQEAEAGCGDGTRQPVVSAVRGAVSCLQPKTAESLQ